MLELIFVVGLAICIFLIRKLGAKLAKVWFSGIIGLVFGGHLMNIVVIRANGGQMPVISDGIDWDDTPSIPVPPSIAKMFGKTLNRVQKTVMGREDVHRNYSGDEVDSVHLKFLADRFPIRIGAEHLGIYSVGDVLIFLGTVLTLFGSLPVWLICRRKKRKTQNAS